MKEKHHVSLIDLRKSREILRTGILYNLVLIITFVMIAWLYGIMYAVLGTAVVFLTILFIDLLITAKRVGLAVWLFLRCYNLTSKLNYELYTYASDAVDKYVEMRGKNYEEDFNKIIERQLLYYLSQLKNTSISGQIDEITLERITSNYNNSFMILPSLNKNAVMK